MLHVLSSQRISLIWRFLSQHPTGNTSGNRIGRYVFSDDGTCPNCHVITDSYPRKNYRVHTNPDVAANVNRGGRFVRLVIAEIMISTYDPHTGANPHIISHCYSVSRLYIAVSAHSRSTQSAYRYIFGEQDPGGEMDRPGNTNIYPEKLLGEKKRRVDINMVYQVPSDRKGEATERAIEKAFQLVLLLRW